MRLVPHMERSPRFLARLSQPGKTLASLKAESFIHFFSTLL